MFTFVDAIVLVVLLGSAVMAFMRGFVHEVLSIAAWVGAGFVTILGFPYVQPWFRGQLGSALTADILAGAALFLVALLGFSVATRAVSMRVKNSALNSVDSSLGFVFGALRGALVLSLAYMVAIWSVDAEEPPAWLAQAKTRPWLQRGAGLIEHLRPEGFGRDPSKREERTATGDLQEDARRAPEIARPVPQTVPVAQPAASPQLDQGQKPRGGYDPVQRKEMDRLFQSNQ